MYKDSYKSKMFKKAFVPKIIGAGLILGTIIVAVLVVNMQESSQLYYEGAVKSMPLLRNEKMKRLGDLYIKLNNEFEEEIKNFELIPANRKNKRGDTIYYGVNGSENIDEMINEDYVNGIEKVTYVKGGADRPDGDSNFMDMIAFMTESLGADIDKYSDEDLEKLFTDLFKLTHTFTGESTELYPCEHGCAWCKYYCGDRYVQGEDAHTNGKVGFYKCDYYLGQNNEYGLMYDPFLIEKTSDYPELRRMASDTSELYTTFENIGEYAEFSSGESVVFRETKTRGRAVTGDDEIFVLMEPEGICEVHKGKNKTFTSTTKKYAGCNPDLTCYHGRPKTKSDEDGNVTLICMQCMGDKKENNCSVAVANFECNYEPPENAEETEEHVCENMEIGCNGYYECTGHDHYSCPGHILVCCFGHTNLKLEIKIMYHKEMIETLANMIK